LLFLKKQQFIFPLEVLIISVKYSLFLSWNFFSSFGCSGVAASWASVVYFYSFGRKKKKVLEKNTPKWEPLLAKVIKSSGETSV